MYSCHENLIRNFVRSRLDNHDQIDYFAGPKKSHPLPQTPNPINIYLKNSKRCAGEAVGRLLEVDRLEAGAIPEGTDDPVVLLVHSASGDEEVGAAGANLKGVILRQSLPHLSHLGAPDLAYNVL